MGKEKLAEFIRAIGLSAHGIGIGSFVYLRRIFEDLIETSHQKASQASGWNEAEYIRGRMDEKILLLKDYLPEFLVENRSAYLILSAGIHSLGEQECLEYYEPLKLAIEIVLDQKLEKQEREEKENLTTKAISQIRSKLRE